ncbi:DUF1737 domain-containing protein [Rhodovulum euryhalinum]|uniref:Uncharacterized protein DUF1737 n=1 Tax=Rhodovulum euryhalinum TaxID=35805 RepID=A0A4R2K9N5_9RHOB|nr:DUF1737 domain-containing protein [Rhodovulum euryhalinum]TCO68852.1 uncharacterized protein DUF1737 [Rhodovulum euryhalinum]
MTTQSVHFTDYKVLEANSAAELSREVMHAIHDRWQPYGNMAVAKTDHGDDLRVKLFQPVVKQAEWYR